MAQKILKTFLKGMAMSKTPEELTEEWKAGKLLAGDYYIKFENGEIERQNNCIGGFLMSCNNRVVQILAPVPTYDEYKAMQSLAQNGESAIDTNKRLCKKIEELCSLLKDIALFFEECNPHDFTVVADNMDVYLTRINAALGESEE